jgi:hypothetical protein
MRPVLAARRKADRSSGRTQTKFELVINLQTAKTMGHEVPAGPGAARLPHLEEGNLWIRATMPPLLAAGSAAYEFHLAAKRSYFHVIVDRVRSRGHRARSGASQPAIGVCSGSLSAIGFCWKRAGAIPS